MTMRATLCGFLFVAAASAGCSGDDGGPVANTRAESIATAVPAGKTLVVIGQVNGAAMDRFVDATGQVPAGFMYYAGLYEAPDVFQRALDDMQMHVGSHPGAAVQLGLSLGAISTPTFSYAAVVPLGQLDAQIEILASWLKHLERTCFLRIGYEFDLLGGQYGPPETYRLAYRYIVDKLRAAGVGNTAYVWHSAGAFWRAIDRSGLAGLIGTLDRTGGGLDALVGVAGALPLTTPLPIELFYPGREYVDYFAISYWDDACCFGRSSPAARAVYRAETRRVLGEAQALGLPLMIGESTPAYVGADSGADSVEWLENYFDLIEEFDIRMFSLIALDWTAGESGDFFTEPFWNGYWPDARIEAYADTKAAYLRRLANPRYVLAEPR